MSDNSRHISNRLLLNEGCWFFLLRKTKACAHYSLNLYWFVINGSIFKALVFSKVKPIIDISITHKLKQCVKGGSLDHCCMNIAFSLQTLLCHCTAPMSCGKLRKKHIKFAYTRHQVMPIEITFIPNQRDKKFTYTLAFHLYMCSRMAQFRYTFSRLFLMALKDKSGFSVMFSYMHFGRLVEEVAGWWDLI